MSLGRGRHAWIDCHLCPCVPVPLRRLDFLIGFPSSVFNRPFWKISLPFQVPSEKPWIIQSYLPCNPEARCLASNKDPKLLLCRNFLTSLDPPGESKKSRVTLSSFPFFYWFIKIKIELNRDKISWIEIFENDSWATFIHATKSCHDEA